jgi:hypothetical protein
MTTTKPARRVTTHMDDNVLVITAFDGWLITDVVRLSGDAALTLRDAAIATLTKES